MDRARGRPVFIISASGRTRSNVQLAKRLGTVASKTVAITCDPGSPLASETDEVIDLGFVPSPRSPGTASFSLSLLAALKVCGLDTSLDFSRALSLSRDAARRVRVSSEAVTYFAGNNELYGASVYGAAKIYELLGARSHATMLEEFSHMELFSLRHEDVVNVLGARDERKAMELARLLDRNGYPCSLVGLVPRDRVQRLYVLVFGVQLAVIEAARTLARKEPYFLTARDKLGISDAMIY